MSEKRRDSKGRLLKTGESQRADGRYLYKYVDKAGKTRYPLSLSPLSVAFQEVSVPCPFHPAIYTPVFSFR